MGVAILWSVSAPHSTPRRLLSDTHTELLLADATKRKNPHTRAPLPQHPTWVARLPKQKEFGRISRTRKKQRTDADGGSLSWRMTSVLHVISDDLRPELGAYGVANTSTPNIDALAASGTVFDRGYAQQAVCGPSRNSFLTGRRPDRSRSWNFINHFREDHPEWTTLPGLFLRANRRALGVGKVWHPNIPPAYDGNLSWSEEALPYKNSCWNTADNPKALFSDGGLPCIPCAKDLIQHIPIIKHAVNVTVANDYCEIDAFEDTLTVSQAIGHLRRAAADGAAFYLAVGLHKPHTPWQASPADFAAHSPSTIRLPLHPLPPIGMPPIAYHFSDAPAHPDPWTPVASDGIRAARRAYRAAVTGMDRKLGRLLRELDETGLTRTTAVILNGDHGWSLGESGSWRKFTNFEAATRVPLIIRAPWLSSGSQRVRRRSSELVELVDLLPTIAELASVSLPPDETFDGVSLVPLLTEGGRSMATWRDKPAAYSQYPRRVTDPARPWHGNGILTHGRDQFTHMGYSARTTEWRYTEWVAWNQSSLTPIWENVTARELYDHRGETTYPTNFDAGELENVVDRQEYAHVAANLSALVRGQFSS
jgi:iduronate 2-sulfatase